MYELTAPDAQAFALSLREGFEDALGAHVDGLGDQAELLRYATRSGHRTRPVGCLLACSAVGSDWAVSLDGAIAIEYVHKASVIRDDIADGDEIRSGQAATHIVYGIPSALAASDVLWTHALRQIAADPDRERADTCLRAFATTLNDMAEGQLEDVSPSSPGQTIEQRLVVEERKTGALSQLACWLGAFLGGGTSHEVDALARYGRKLGTAFQIVNDVRNLCGTETTRSIASDIRQRRDTVLSAYARSTGSAEARELLDALWLGSDELTDSQVDEVRLAMLTTDAPRFGHETAEQLMRDARKELDVLPRSLAREILESLTEGALLAYAF